ncbi:hypothetical protein CDAR_218581 [Caerostris darwini]|uniref:Uncharacterized protein n=1 Tax=Caerostris darwini TaxID=1538125 RepID=A0AAV4VCU0_9ARAC|nr:hypothetical protein CDAR_218581 [Caerostris darwini]
MTLTNDMRQRSIAGIQLISTKSSVDLTSQSFEDKSGEIYVAEETESALFPLLDLGLKNLISLDVT